MIGFTPASVRLGDPTGQTVIVDEFLFASVETGEIGELGWSFTNGSANLAGAPEDQHPGIVARASSATQDQVASMYPGGGGTAVSVRVDQVDENTWVIEPQTTGADFDVRFGLFSDATSATPTNGVYFERLAADTNWFAVTRQSATETRTDMGVAFSGNWTKLRLRRVPGTGFAFSINGGAEQVVTANIPNGVGTMVFGNHIIPRTAAARSINLDFFSLKLAAQTR